MDARDALAATVRHLEGNARASDATGAVRTLLSSLGALHLTDAGARQDLARLLAISTRLKRIFQLQPPDMPGLFFFGAQVDPTHFGADWGSVRGVAGIGTRPLDAFRGCMGEAAEYLSQHLCTGQALPAVVSGDVHPADSLVVANLTALSDPPCWFDVGDWCAATVLVSGWSVDIPFDLCWRRNPAEQQVRPRSAPGLGCAAGQSRDLAALAAVLEVVERDALALWWRGGRRARPVSSQLQEKAGFAQLRHAARGQRDGRLCWFLDLTTDVGVPVIAAISIGQAGRGFAFGVSAALRAEDALRSAFLELGQLELADHLVRMKLATGGEARLNDIDRMHRCRSETDMGDWPLLQPRGQPADHAAWYAELEGWEPAARLAPLAHRLQTRGHEILLVDQTNARIGVPVIRALIPTLQPDPGDVETSRLHDVRASNENGSLETRPRII